MSALPKQDAKKRFYASEQKWGKPLMATGFTLMPSVVLEYQQRLDLDPIDLVLLLQIIKHWWDAGEAPFPSRKALAACIGRDVSTVQRRLTRLQKKGLIEITHRFHANHGGQTSSSYTFNGLIAKATAIAEEKLATKNKRKAEDAVSRKRRPKVVSTGAIRLAKTDR